MAWLVGASFFVALGFGLWLGRPRRFDQSIEEIEERLGEAGEHQKVRRIRTVFTLFQRKVERGSHARRRQRTRKPFRMS